MLRAINRSGRFNINETIKYMDKSELDALLSAFRRYYYDGFIAPAGCASGVLRLRRRRGRYWLVFLVARYTGARISEVLAIDDARDIDFKASSIRLRILKRKEELYRMVPVPWQVIGEINLYLTNHPDMRGRIFKVNRSNFFKKMQEIGLAINLPKEKLHPNVLRHSRAMEMIWADTPLNVVQAALGHASILNTSLYLALSGAGIAHRRKLKGKGTCMVIQR